MAQSESNEKHFTVDIRDGKFVYDPEPPWVYLPDDKVRWVSMKGEMTVMVGGHAEYPSPFDDRQNASGEEAEAARANELNGRRFKTDESQNPWQTRSVTVRRVFPPRQQLFRRLASAGSLEYDFTFEVIETGPNGPISRFETVRGMGSMC